MDKSRKTLRKKMEESIQNQLHSINRNYAAIQMRLQICNIASCFHRCTNYVHEPTQDGEFRKHHVRFIAILTYNSATGEWSVHQNYHHYPQVSDPRTSLVFSTPFLHLKSSRPSRAATVLHLI
jgi:hypothetical protein